MSPAVLVNVATGEVHLRNPGTTVPACGPMARTRVEVADLAAVTCESCKRTVAYRRAQQGG